MLKDSYLQIKDIHELKRKHERILKDIEQDRDIVQQHKRSFERH